MLAPQMNRWTHIVIHSSTSTTFSDNTRITKCNFAMTVSVNAGQKGFSPIIGHSVWGEKLYTHQWLCQTCTMSVLPVWNSTIAFTMSMSNFNTFDACQNFQQISRREISSSQASFTHAGRSNLFSSVFTCTINKSSVVSKAFLSLFFYLCN